jgi:hypothetical protein
LSDLSELLNDKVKLYLFNYSGKDVFNLGIENLKVNTQIFEKDKPVSFQVTVRNYSTRQADNAVISIFVEKERSAQQSVSLSGGESKIIEMDAVIKSSGYIEVFAELEDDEILHDNRRFTNLFIPAQLPVIVFADNNPDAKFVEMALTAAENERPVKVTLRNSSQLNSINLEQFESVVIIGSENISNPGRLNSYIENGGGVMIMPGKNSTLEGFNKLTQSLNIPSASNLHSTEGAVSFQQVEFNHPLFHDMFSDAGKRNIESPDIFKHFAVSSGGRGLNIISLINGASFLSEYKIGRGKILLMNTAPILEWSNFPLKSVFVPLLNKSVFYLASKDRNETEFFAGSIIEVNLRNQSHPQIRVEKPDGTAEFVNQSNGNFLRIDNSKTAGNYRVYSGENLIEIVSVNTDPRESVTEYLTSGNFEEYLDKINFKGKYIYVSKDDNPVEIVLQSRFGSELWRYFLLAALLTALLEMAVARSAKKDLASVS